MWILKGHMWVSLDQAGSLSTAGVGPTISRPPGSYPVLFATFLNDSERKINLWETAV